MKAFSVVRVLDYFEIAKYRYWREWILRTAIRLMAKLICSQKNRLISVMANIGFNTS